MQADLRKVNQWMRDEREPIARKRKAAGREIKIRYGATTNRAAGTVVKRVYHNDNGPVIDSVVWKDPIESASAKIFAWEAFTGSFATCEAFEIVKPSVLEARLNERAALFEETSKIAHEFNALVEKWNFETAMLSDVHKISMHPAYQRIVGMGKAALPLIFRELNKSGGHWFWALNAIVGQDVAKHGKSYRDVVELWLAWGKENGYIHS